jgi:HSP20 family molecular chaperone IbpA
MALIPHSFFPRSAFDMDEWFKSAGNPNPLLAPNTLDLFDPYDELDHMIGRNLQWLNKPEFIQPLQALLPKVPQKYRIIVDCVGYKPESIKTDIKGHRLVVAGREEVKHEGEDFSVKEFKKTYQLPAHSEPEKLVSFMTSHGQLVIEVPLKETALHLNNDLFPVVVDTEKGGKAVQLQFTVPENIDPSKISVSVKDRDLIVKAEDKVDKPDGISKFYYYKRTTLPENTDFKHLKCNYENHRISVNAPLNLNYKPYRTVPIEHKKHEAINQK